MGELKGSWNQPGIGADFASAKGMESWQIQRHAALMRGREISPNAGPVPTEGASRKHPDEGERPAGMVWAPTSFLAGGDHQPPVPAFTWCRAKLRPTPGR